MVCLMENNSVRCILKLMLLIYPKAPLLVCSPMVEGHTVVLFYIGFDRLMQHPLFILHFVPRQWFCLCVSYLFF